MKLELSPSGRAACRGCKQPIPKGELRFAESYSIPGGGGEGFRYWHLACAAKKAGAGLKTAIAAYEGEISNRAELETLLAQAPQKAAERPLPHVDHAPTGRARCMVCDTAIEKGSWRIGVEREVDTGAFTTRGPGYLHPKCAVAWTQEHLEDTSSPADWMATLFGNSGLTQEQVTEVTQQLTPE